MSTVRAFLRDAAESYFLLVTAVALNSPLILAFILASLVGNGLAWTTAPYSVAVAVGYYCLPLLVVVSAVFLLTAPVRRAATSMGMILVMLFVTYLLLDMLAYRSVRFHIDPFWIEFAMKDHSGLGLPSSTWVVVLGIVLAVVAIEIGIVALARRIRGRVLVVAFPVVAVLAFASSQIVHLVAYEWNNQRITSLTPHFPLYIPITSHSNASAYRDMLPWVDAQAAVTTADNEGHTFHYPLTEMEFSGEKSVHNPNVVFILLESWRYDTLDEETSPNIHALGQRSSVFLDHLSTGNQTTCGVFGLFYGLHATYWTAVKANSAEIDNPVLIDVLRERDYQFGIFAKSRFKRHKIKDTVFNGIRVRESFAGNSNFEEDADLTRQMVRFIEEQAKHDQRFFALAFFKSTHAPYEYPPEHEVFNGSRKVNMGFTNGGTDPAPRLRRYRNAVHYVDALVGDVVESLDRLGLMENTVIVVTTDHGESFNDNGSNYWGHGSNYTQYQTRVPLVFYAPGRSPQRFSHRTSHIDVAPTLLSEYFGCTSEIGVYSNGRILFDTTAGIRPLAVGSYVNHAFVFGDDVHEIRPMWTKKYKLRDVKVTAGWPDPSQVKKLAEEVRRFSGP